MDTPAAARGHGQVLSEDAERSSDRGREDRKPLFRVTKASYRVRPYSTRDAEGVATRPSLTLTVVILIGTVVLSASVNYDGGKEPTRAIPPPDPASSPTIGPTVTPCPGILSTSPATLSLNPPPGISSPCPGVVMGTYLGGHDTDWAWAIAADSAGNMYVAGVTFSDDFPTTPAAHDRVYAGLKDAFVAKYDPEGLLVYSTFLGGTGDDVARGIAVDAAGNAYVTGRTTSWNFPTTPDAYDQFAHGSSDVFIARLDPNGALAYSTRLGGADEDQAWDIAVDSEGSPYVTGYTNSGDFPATPGAFVSMGAVEDVFVAKLNPNGTLAYAARIGAQADEFGDEIAVDAHGRAYVVGYTASSDFVTTPDAFDTVWSGVLDAFVFRLNPEGSALEYSTFLGGVDEDYGHGIDVDAEGNAYVVGDTLSPDFPTTPGAVDTTFNGGNDAYVVKFEPDGRLAYATFLGGANYDEANGLDLGPDGYVYTTGETYSNEFPSTLGAFDATHNGNGDAFVAKLDPDSGGLVYASFLGGSVNVLDACCGDVGTSLAADSTGNVTVVGGTVASDFPTTTGSRDLLYGGLTDAFVARLEPIPDPNRPPVAYFVVHMSVDTPNLMMADPSNSADAEDVNALLEARWDWEDDGVWDVDWSALGPATHRYSARASHTIRLEIRDTSGLTANVTQRTPFAALSPLTVNVASSVTSGVVPFTVQFHGSASGGRPLYSFSWDFGDGSTSTSPEPSHEYRVAGNYEVRLTVTDAGGVSSTRTLSIVARPGTWWLEPYAVVAFGGLPAVLVGAAAYLVWQKRRGRKGATKAPKGSEHTEGRRLAVLVALVALVGLAGLSLKELDDLVPLSPEGALPPEPLLQTSVPGLTTIVSEASPLPISDDFNDNMIDEGRWRVDEGVDTSIRETNGRLEITHASNANGDVFGAGVKSLRPVFGDFDIRVRYMLLKWPVLNLSGQVVELAPETYVKRTNGVRVGLGVETWRFGATMERSNFGPDELYAANFNDNVLTAGVRTRDREGTLRLQRIGATVTAYLEFEGFWMKVQERELTDEPAYVFLNSWSHDEYFLGEEVRLAYDDLIVVEPLQLSVAATPLSGTAPLSTSFASTPFGGMIPYSYAWTFGDGGTSPQANPTHVYREPGSYEVALTVTDIDGGTLTKTTEVVVEPAPPDLGVAAKGTESFDWAAYAASVTVASGVVASLLWLRRRRRHR